MKLPIQKKPLITGPAQADVRPVTLENSPMIGVWNGANMKRLREWTQREFKEYANDAFNEIGAFIDSLEADEKADTLAKLSWAEVTRKGIRCGKVTNFYTIDD